MPLTTELDYWRVLQSLSTAVIILDQGLNITFLNEAAQVLLQSSAKRVIGNALSSVVSDNKELFECCDKALHDYGQFRLRNHDLLIPAVMERKEVNCAISKVEISPDARLMLEITEVESANHATRDKEFASRQQSNQAVIRGLAHEIRNPLGGIRGAAQLLAEEAGSDVFAEYTQVIIQEADRLTNLVNRMQARTRVDLEQSINIHDVLEHVRRLVIAEDGTQCQIEQDYDPSLPAVRGDRELLVQAILNVIRNAEEAVSYLHTEGKVLLRTRIDHIASDDGNKMVVRVDVCDNGIGISKEIAQRIFDPMVTNKAGGTGLGLPITAEIITRHGGAIDFESDPDRTVFRLYLPVGESP